jgi:hypothetical protein
VNLKPVDLPIVITRGADEPGSQADKALTKTVEAMIERGVSVRVQSSPQRLIENHKVECTEIIIL